MKSILAKFISLLPTGSPKDIVNVANFSFGLTDIMMPNVFRGNGSDPEFIFYEGPVADVNSNSTLNRIDINPLFFGLLFTPFKPGDTL